MYACGCEKFLWPLIGQLQRYLTTFGAGTGNDHLHHTGLKCCLNHLFAIDIERVMGEVTTYVYEFHGAHCNVFFNIDACTSLPLPYNLADASEMERHLATDAVRPADWHIIAVVADAVGAVDSG